MTYNRKLVFASACLGMFTFGVVMTVLGSVLPSLITQFSIEKTRAGSLFTVLSLGVMAGSVFFGPVVDRYGYRLLLFVCSLLVGMGLEGIALANSMAALYVSAFLIGVGGGVLNGGTNALVADISEDGRSADLSLLGVFFGVGAFGIPFLIGNLLHIFTYGELVAGIGALALLPMVFFASVRFPAPKHPQGFPLALGGQLIKDPVLLLTGAVLFLQSGMEITVGGWSSTFFREELALPTDRAVLALSLFWAGMMVSRLAMGWLLRRMAASKVLIAMLLVALAGALLMLSGGSAELAAAGLFLLGAGLAATYPIMLGYTGDRYPELSGTAFGILFVIALTGGSLFPLATGWLGASAGLRTSFLLVPASLLVVLALFVGILERRLTRKIPVT